MKYLPVIITGLLIFSGCLDFLEEEESNQAPTAVIKIEGSSPYEPDEEIIFTGKGSNDLDGDSLEYYWDFDSSDSYNDNKVGDISRDGRITHSYSQEKTYTVTLTVSDGDKTSSITAKVKVEKPSSELRAIVTTDDDTDETMNGDEQKSYTFSAAESISDSRITKYEWDFSYDSADGFVVDEETSNPEINHNFDSGLYTIKVRITNEMGETDEAGFSDDVELRINYDYSTTRTIDSGQQEHLVQLYGLPARYIRATLEYETSSFHDDDLDLYLYNHTQDKNPDQDEGNNQDEECNECVAKNYTHDSSETDQINFIEMDYYNSTHRSWFDERNELGDWFIVVDHERGNTEYTIRIEVIYWE